MTYHVAWSPLPVWKDNGIQNQQCCQGCFENYRQILEDCTVSTSSSTKTSKRVAACCGKQVQASISCKQIKTKKTLSQRAGHLSVGKLQVFRSLVRLPFIIRSRLHTQWQARVASNQHHRSKTDKPEPTNDAQERVGRLEHTIAQA